MHPGEARRAAERTTALAIRHNPFGEGGPDSRKTDEFVDGRVVDVNPLALADGTRKKADRIAMGDRVSV
jgi:hypothetical protein